MSTKAQEHLNSWIRDTEDRPRPMRHFETGATRDSDESKLDYEGFLNPFVLQRFAEYMHENRVQADGNLRDSDNWQKGIPKDAYMKSLMRHCMTVWQKHRSGENPSRDLCAMLFNVQGYLLELLKEEYTERLTPPSNHS